MSNNEKLVPLHNLDDDMNLIRGISVVEDALLSESYPMDRESVNYAVGDIEVETGDGGWIVVRDLMDRVHLTEFDDAKSLLTALHEAVDEIRKEAA